MQYPAKRTNYSHCNDDVFIIWLLAKTLEEWLHLIDKKKKKRKKRPQLRLKLDRPQILPGLTIF